MKIALKAANGLYVCAEQGGGIDTRNPATPVALRANRTEVGIWETFEVIQVGDRVALKTHNGNYVTAEGDGGSSLRTNATQINAWEQFNAQYQQLSRNGEHYALTPDGVHFVCAEVGSADPVVNCTRTAVGPWETFEVIRLDAPISKPTKDQILDVKANFISMRDAFGRVMLSWLWPLLPENEQRDWFQRWRAAGLTHVVMCPVMSYPKNALGPGGTDLWADWRTDPQRFASAVVQIREEGFIPILQMTSGDGGTGNDVQQYWPALLQALGSSLPYCLVTPGFEVVGPGGGWTSAQLSRGLQVLHAANPGALGVHLQPERATGASHPVEPDDPWQGDEAGFWRSHGGEFVDILLYQCPHGSKLLDRSGAAPGVGAWEDRWNEILDRLGKGALGWRQVHVCCFEKTGYDYYHGNATDSDVTWTSGRAQYQADVRGVPVSYGDGLP